MTKLSFTDRQKLNQLILDLRERVAQVEGAIDIYNDTVICEFGKVQKAVANYNRTLSAALEFTDRIHTDMRDYLDDMSDKWAESDSGEAYNQWAEQWGSIDLEQVEIEEPAEIEAPELSHADALLNLPDSPG